MNLSGSFVWVFVNGLILATYELPDNLSVLFFSLPFISMFSTSELIDFGAIKL